MQLKHKIKKYILVKETIIACIFCLTVLHQQAGAQQMFVDDAVVTTYRSFQVETAPGYNIGVAFTLDQLW